MSCNQSTNTAWRRFSRVAAATAAGLVLSAPAQAVQFKLADGAIDGSFDTTIGWGMNMRTRSHNPTRAGGLAGMVGNRAVAKWEVFNNTIKASHDLALNGKNWGVFVRGNYFYDADADHEDIFQKSARNKKVSNGEFTDAYAWARFGADEQFMIRLGKQVISWGENTFIGHAINDINTVDLTKLRVPGVELKDAFIGTPAAYFSWDINESWSLDTFALFTFDEFKADPAGAFFLTNDAFGDGNQGFPNAAGFCPSPDGGVGVAGNPFGGPAGAGFGPTICSADDSIPSGGGQWGLALHYFSDWGNGIDFGFFYQNLHDHIFKLGAIAGSADSGVAGAIPGPDGRYIRFFPENIERWGASFSTIYGPWAWYGEYGYRRNMKLQGDAGVILARVTAGVDNLNPALGLAGTALVAGTRFESEAVRDYGHHQLQMTFQRLWGPMPELYGADQWNTIFEVVHGWVTDMPGQSTFNRFDENISNNWQGFKGRSSITYNNALFNSVNITFKQAFNWDIRGNSSEFGGAKAFIEDRKTASLGLDFDYKLRYKWGVSMTWFFDGVDDYTDNLGIRRQQDNSSADRDFLGFHASYVF